MKTKEFWTGLIGGIIGWVFLYPLIAQQVENPLLQPSARQVIERRCTRCHSGERPPNGIRLENFLTVSLFVSAYNPEKSWIMQAMTGMGKTQMPPMYPLDWKEINAVRRWIIAGADSKSYEERMQMTSMGGREVDSK